MAVTRGRAWNVNKAAGHLTGIKPRSGKKPRRERWRAGVAYLQVAPLVAVFAAFLVFPIALIVVVSFWDYSEYAIVPDFIVRNYAEVFGSAVTYKAYLSTLKFAALTWAITLV